MSNANVVEATNLISQGITPSPFPISIGHGVFTGNSRSKIIRKSVDTLPNAMQAVELFNDRIRMEDRIDTETPISALSMTNTGHLTRGVGSLTVSAESLGQLLSRTTFSEPMAAASYLLAIPPSRRSAEFNAIVKEHAKDQTVVLRHRKNVLPNNTTSGRGVYAAVSTRYVIHDAHEALLLFIKKMSQFYNLTELKMSLLSDTIRSEAFIHYRTIEDGSESHSAYFRFKTGDSGKHSHQGEHGVMRLVCKNGLTIFDKSASLHARHTGDNSIQLVNGMVQNGNNVLESFFRQWNQAQETRLLDMVEGAPEYIGTESLVRGTYRGLIKDAGLTLPGYRGEKAVDELFHAWEAEPVQTKAGIVNGITRAAHESSLLSLWSADDVQEAAGKILASSRKIHFASE